MAFKKECRALQKIKDEEEIFVLRAQDASAGRIIILWIYENWHHASDAKLKEAFECALRMQKYPKKKA